MRLNFLLGVLLLAAGCQSWGKFWEVDVCEVNASYTDAIKAERAEQFMYHLRAQRDKGATGNVAANNTTIAGLTNNDLKWSGGVLAPNGKIYAIPRQSDAVAIIDPAADTLNLTKITGVNDQSQQMGGRRSCAEWQDL